jgi:hypothetical protein
MNHDSGRAVIAKRDDSSLRITAADVARLRGVGINRVREDVRVGKQPGALFEGRRLLFDRATVLRSLGLGDGPVSTSAVDEIFARIGAALRAAADVLDP